MQTYGELVSGQHDYMHGYVIVWAVQRVCGANIRVRFTKSPQYFSGHCAGFGLCVLGLLLHLPRYSADHGAAAVTAPCTSAVHSPRSKAMRTRRTAAAADAIDLPDDVLDVILWHVTQAAAGRQPERHLPPRSCLGVACQRLQQARVCSVVCHEACRRSNT